MFKLSNQSYFEGRGCQYRYAAGLTLKRAKQNCSRRPFFFFFFFTFIFQRKIRLDVSAQQRINV